MSFHVLENMWSTRLLSVRVFFVQGQLHIGRSAAAYLHDSTFSNNSAVAGEYPAAIHQQQQTMTGAGSLHACAPWQPSTLHLQLWLCLSAPSCCGVPYCRLQRHSSSSWCRRRHLCRRWLSPHAAAHQLRLQLRRVRWHCLLHKLPNLCDGVQLCERVCLPGEAPGTACRAMSRAALWAGVPPRGGPCCRQRSQCRSCLMGLLCPWLWLSTPRGIFDGPLAQGQ